MRRLRRAGAAMLAGYPTFVRSLLLPAKCVDCPRARHVMPKAKNEAEALRVIAHFDLDCFYVQVEQRRRPELKGRPTAVVQFNAWKGGGLIAVGYEARAKGVTRNMRGDEARTRCPDLELVQVPIAHGHADLTTYRAAGSEVISILQRLGKTERASIDEAYVNLTSAARERLKTAPLNAVNLPADTSATHILGLPPDEGAAVGWLCDPSAGEEQRLLGAGAVIVAELRATILAETGFTTSAGIAPNKMLAKLCSGLHKPFQQTLLPNPAVRAQLDTLPIPKLKQLGGKMGQKVQAELKVGTVGEVRAFPQAKLQELLGTNAGEWLYLACRGQDGSPVAERVLPKSHSCGKSFLGPVNILRNWQQVDQWVAEMSSELWERLEADYRDNGRTSRLLTAHASFVFGRPPTPLHKHVSRSVPLRDTASSLARDAFTALRRLWEENRLDAKGEWGVAGITVSASQIQAPPAGNASIKSFLMTSSRPHLPPGDSDAAPRVPPGSRGGDAACGGSEGLPPGNRGECHGGAAAEVADAPGGVHRGETRGGAAGETLVHCVERRSEKHVPPGEEQTWDPLLGGGDVADRVGGDADVGCQLAALQRDVEADGLPPTSATPPATSASPPATSANPPATSASHKRMLSLLPLPPFKKSRLKQKGSQRDSLKNMWDQAGTRVKSSTQEEGGIGCRLVSDDSYGEGKMDASALAELPHEIRKEVEAALTHAKRVNVEKTAAPKGISIYFR